jgi:hypothetical protein
MVDELNNLNELPEWDDDDELEDKDGEEWKPNPTYDACKVLYKKWNEIMMMLNGALGGLKELPDEDEVNFVTSRMAMILGDAYEVGAKIQSSEAGGIYIIRMENAAIIRKNAQTVRSFILTLMIEGEIDEEHGEIIRNEINQFRKLYKHWLSTFEKDEFEDEWGLFI